MMLNILDTVRDGDIVTMAY